MERAKKTAEYQTKCCAVKKIQKAKRGIEINKQAIPAKAAILLSFFKRTRINIITKAKSCIFIFS